MPEHLPEWIAAAFVIAGAIFNSGMFFATVKFHGGELKKHDAKHKEHYVKLESHGQSLAVLQAWHDGQANRSLHHG